MLLLKVVGNVSTLQTSKITAIIIIAIIIIIMIIIMTVFIYNRQFGGKCEYHMQGEYYKMKSKRMDCQGAK